MAEDTPVKSPCVNVCTLNEQDICIGCYRSATEIARWTSMTAVEQREVIARADKRYQAIWDAARDARS